eukprot:TRINITY_DN3080_c0_g1_i4.p1 TRINITY_DN3080_c0_g1~~TRINITY_DN3080_c0_g1_i4.p1  ORF type:complete len:299 (+),score=94.80 TRINITY_DN3080_c0_g1_i4:97-993(+)
MVKRNSVESSAQGLNVEFKKNYGTAYDDEESNSCCAVVITIISWLIIILTLPISIWSCIKVVQEYERAVIFRLGRLRSGRAKGPGMFFIIPCIDTYRCVDLRTGAFDVPPQEILTKDSVTVNVDAVVYYQVSNPLAAICNNDDYNRSTRLLAATTLRNVLGTKNLADILSDREAIAENMHRTLEEATDPWGVHVDRVEIKDVRLPMQLQRAMAAEAEATRDARAKVIAADGEYKSSKALKEAADIISSSPAALQLRYLQTLHTISAEKNSTIIFPLPMEIVGAFAQDGLRQRKIHLEE